MQYLIILLTIIMISIIIYRDCIHLTTKRENLVPKEFRYNILNDF